MTGTTAKAHLLDLLLEPLRGCAGLYPYRQELMNEVLKMPVLEVQDRLDYLQRTHFKSSLWSYKPLRATYSKTKSFLLFGSVKRPLPSGSWHGRGLLRL